MPVVLSDLSFTVPNGRPILSGLSAAFGPGRTGLIGANGSGKSTLLRLITGELRPASGSVTTGGDVGYLPQDLTLDAGAPVGRLSGGETIMTALAALFLRRPAVILLDEPTNSLDMASVRQLSQALSCYRGAMVVASHGVPFLRSTGITRWLRLERDGRLMATDPL